MAAISVPAAASGEAEVVWRVRDKGRILPESNFNGLRVQYHAADEILSAYASRLRFPA